MKSIVSLLLALTSLGFSLSAQGGSATWSNHPVNDDWYTAENWMPTTVPNGPTDIATIGPSTVPSVLLPEQSVTELDSLILEKGGYVTVPDQASLSINGQGILTKSLDVGVDLQPGSTLTFRNASLSEVTFDSYGHLIFQDDSTSPGILNKEGQVTFQNRAKSGGSITSYGSQIAGKEAATVTFLDQSEAVGSFIVNPGSFGGNPSVIFLNDDSVASALYLYTSGGGVLDISGHHGPGVAVAGLGGNGACYLGGNTLTITRNYDYGFFSGPIQDGGASGGTGGSLIKTGGTNDVFGLTADNTYTGGTFIEGGTLVVRNKAGSATGSGPVEVNNGALKGAGSVTGPVTVGNEGVISPGVDRAEVLTIAITKNLIFASGAEYRVGIDSQNPKMSRLRAGGVTIAPGAKVRFNDRYKGHIDVGASFTIIDNTSHALIAGTFARLPDGGTVTIGNNTYQADYEGGDGNDLTLTVVP